MLAPDEDHSFSPSKPLSHRRSNYAEIDSSESSNQGENSMMQSNHVKMRNSVLCCSSFAFILSALFFLLAALGAHYINETLDKSINSDLSLVDQSSSQYQYWSNNVENPPTVTVYVYDILNADAIMNGAAPQLRELGPYVFYDRRVKFNVSLVSDDQSNVHKLFYHENQYYEFLPDQSVNDPRTQNVTTLNMIAQGFYWAYTPCDSTVTPYQAYQLLGASERDILFANRTVYEVLFGWTETIPPFFTIPYPGILSNQSSDIYSGIYVDDSPINLSDTPSMNRQYFLWNNASTVTTPADPACYLNPAPVWKSAAANSVRGSDAGAFAVNQTFDQSVTQVLFYPPYRRAIDLAYDQSTDFKGVEVFRYKVPDSLYDNTTVDARNADYYQFNQGAINLTSTSVFVPSFATSPRQASIKDWSPLHSNLNITYIDGVTPPDSFFEVETHTGLTVHFTFSSQANVLIGPLSLVDTDGNPQTWFANVTSTLLPLMWAVEETQMSDDDAKIFRLVQNARKALNWAPYAFYPLGAVFMLMTLGCSVRERRRVNKLNDQWEFNETSKLNLDLGRSTYTQNEWKGSPRSSATRLTTSSETYGWE